MAEPLRHRQTKGAETDMPSLPPPRHIPTLPFADLPPLSTEPRVRAFVRTHAPRRERGEPRSWEGPERRGAPLYRAPAPAPGLDWILGLAPRSCCLWVALSCCRIAWSSSGSSSKRATRKRCGRAGLAPTRKRCGRAGSAPTVTASTSSIGMICHSTGGRSWGSDPVKGFAIGRLGSPARLYIRGTGGLVAYTTGSHCIFNVVG